MSNDINIKIRADQTEAKTDVARAESDKLKKKVVDDSAAMTRATEQLEKAHNRQADAAGKVRVAEAKLTQTYENSKASLAQVAAAEEDRAKRMRDAETAAKAVTAAEEKLAKLRATPPPPPPPTPEVKEKPGEPTPRRSFDVSSSLFSKDQLLSEAKSYGIQAGAVLGGAIGAGAAPLAAAGLFVGIAAAAQSSNPQVAAAYSKLWDQVKAGAQDASSELSSTFISSAESLGRTFNALKPELTEGFIAAKPVINDVMDGIDRGARTAMPGLVTAAKAASQASNGVADALESSGRAVSNFFTESSQGAAAGGDAFRAFGTVVERLGSFAGRILAELANSSGTVWAPMISAVDSTATAVETLAHTALPSLASGASMAFSGLSLLMQLATALLNALGPMVPVIMQVASALKLIDMVSFGQVGKSWGAFKSAVGEGEGLFGKIAAGAGALTGTLGPVGLAAGVVTVGLSELSYEQGVAAQAAELHTKRVDTLTDALHKSKGAIDSDVRSAAVQALGMMQLNQAYLDGEKVKKNVLQGASELGIQQDLLTNAYLGQSGALQSLNGQLDSIMKPYKDYNDMVAHATPEEQKRWMAAELLKDTINKQGSEFATAAQKAADLSAAEGQASGAASILADDFAALANKASTAQQKTDALMHILDTLAGRKPDVEAATEAWEKFMDAFDKKDMNFQDKGNGAKKYVQTLIDTSGQIKLTTDDGRKLYDTVREGEKDFQQTATAMHDSGASADDTRAKLNTMRDAFVKNAEQMGFNSTQANQLADKYGLIPDSVTTLVYSNVSPEIQKVLDLGGTIKSLPNGSFVVTANTSQAQYQVTKFIQDNSGKVITVHVNTVSGSQVNVSSGSFARLQASGGPVAHAAEGGARTGMVVVNEMGQEAARLPGGDVVTLPMGSSVIPHANVSSMAADGRAGGVVKVQLMIGSGGGRLEELLLEIFRELVWVKGGGDVQLAFGRAA